MPSVYFKYLALGINEVTSCIPDDAPVCTALMGAPLECPAAPGIPSAVMNGDAVLGRLRNWAIRSIIRRFVVVESRGESGDRKNTENKVVPAKLAFLHLVNSIDYYIHFVQNCEL